MFNEKQFIPPVTIVQKLAYYRKEDWSRYKDLMQDPESLHDTWEEWEKDFLDLEKSLRNTGHETIRVVINLNDLAEYCARERIAINGTARAAFVVRQ